MAMPIVRYVVLKVDYVFNITKIGTRAAFLIVMLRM